MKRIKVLDGVRGIAIFLVLLWHYIHGQADVDSALAKDLVKFLSLAWSGVDLFFVLSGFLIVGILLDAKGSSSFFSTFYIRRALRILPLYLVLLLLFIVLPVYIVNEKLFSPLLPLWSYFTFTQNFFMIKSDFGPEWLGVTWSLAIEEQFYLFLPLMIWSLTRKRLVYVFLSLICLAPILRLIFNSFGNNLGSYVFPLSRADSILMGGLLAVIHRTPQIRGYLKENYSYLVWAFFIFLFGAGAITFSSPGIGNAFTHLWLAVLYSLFLMVCILRSGRVVDILVSNKFFVWLGLRSYGIYLFHQPVSFLVHQFVDGHNMPYFSNWPEFRVTIFALFVTIVLAEISFRFFESIFLSYGRKFHYGTNSSPQPM